MGGTGAGGHVSIARRLSALAAGLAFYVVPGLLVATAVSARTAGIVDSRPVVEERMRPHLDDARAAARAEGVPLPLILAVASVESAGRPDARSGAGAVGLMQLMPDTAADMAAEVGVAPRRTDPAISLRLGARYLARQLRASRGYAAQTELALCAYNAGPGRVRTWLAERPFPADEPHLGTWIPPQFSETRAYVSRVTEWRERWEDTLAAWEGGPAPSR